MKELPINPPDPEPLPICPECGEELGTYDQVFLDSNGVYLGCSCCIERKYADDYFSDLSDL